MNLTTEIFLPDQVWFQIFKYINRKALMKLRNVNVELMNLIENFGGWKSLFFDSSTLVPWRSQLCQMHYPKLTSDEYDSLPDSFYKKLIAFYISWKGLGNAKEPQRVALCSKEDSIFQMIWKYDSYGNFLAYISVSDKLYIFNENTLKLVSGPLNILEFEADRTPLKVIKIWQPHSSDSEDEAYLLERKLFIIVLRYDSMLIWDVDEKVSVPVPEIIDEVYRDRENRASVKRLFRCDNDIFVYMTEDIESNFIIVKLGWNQREKKITGRIIFRILNPPNFYTICTLFDMYTENQKLMLVFRGGDMFYFTQTDIPKVNDQPRIMSLTNNSAEFKRIFPDFQRDLYKAKVRINNSYVVTAYDDTDFYVALKKETQDGGYDLVTKSIHRFDRCFQISDCIFKFDVLFILTTQGELRIYTFKNSNHLMDIDLFTHRAKVIATGIDLYPKMRLMTRKNIPHALIVSRPLHLIFVKL